jgi:hypothetical protein
MPISAILGRFIAQALHFDFATSPSFHREVTRDLNRLYSALPKPLAERSQADKILLLRYAATASVCRANPEIRRP